MCWLGLVNVQDFDIWASLMLLDGLDFDIFLGVDC